MAKKRKDRAPKMSPKMSRQMPLAEALRLLLDEVLLPFKESSLYDDYKNAEDAKGFTDEQYESAIAAINLYLGR